MNVQTLIRSGLVGGAVWVAATAGAANITNILANGEVVVQFKDAANGDYTLRRSSPHRDAGTKLGWMTVDATDLAGNPRVVTNGKTLAENPDALPDLGAYEQQECPRGMMLLVR